MAVASSPSVALRREIKVGMARSSKWSAILNSGTTDAGYLDTGQVLSVFLALSSVNGNDRVRFPADAQVGIDDAAVMQQRLGRAAQRHGPHFQHIGAVGHLQRGAGILFDQQHPVS